MRVGATLIVLLAAVALARGDGATNPVPTAEAFESFADGMAIDQAPGWSLGEQADSETGRVTTNALALEALSAYTAAGGTLPLDTNHTKVLALNGPVAQQVAGPAGRLVRTDLLVMPWRREMLPTPDPTMQAAICFNSNGQAVVFHHDTLAGTNEWRTLETAPPLASQTWVRVTFLQDYAHHLYQVRLNDGTPLEDAAGWSGPPPGGTQGGTWFRMPNTNGVMSRVSFFGTGQAFLDDLEILKDLPGGVATLAASNVTATTADLPGSLSSTGLAETAVAVYWGTTDGGTNAAAWAHTNVWDAPQAPGGFTTNVPVTSDAVVFYRFAAMNAYGQSWSDHSEFLVMGAVSMDPDSDNGAKERPVETGTYTIVRPEFATNVALTVGYVMTGTASNGVDYVPLTGTVVIPLGATRVDIVLTPIPDGILESNETARLTLIPGPYLIGSPNSKLVTIENAQPAVLNWSNGSRDRQWNSSSANWYEGLFSTLDSVIFDDIAVATGRVTVTSAAVISGQITVAGGQYEFDGGAIQGGPVAIQGGRAIDRVLTRSLFGSGTIALSGGGEFWRQATNNTIPVLQVFSNAFSVAGAGGTLQGGPGTNAWRGGVELGARLNLGFTNAVAGHVNRFEGVLTVNQNTNSPGARVVALRAGGGQAYLDGPIVDDPDTNPAGAFPLVLETQAGAGVLTLTSTGNTYACGTVVTNAGGTNGVVVAAGSSLGRGPVTVVGTGAWLRVQGAGAIVAPLTVGSNATVVLATNGAVLGPDSTVTVASGALLVLQSGDCLPDNGVLALGTAGRVQTGSNLVEVVADLYIGDQRQQGGVYTIANLPANILGSGAIRVRGTVPTGAMILVR